MSNSRLQRKTEEQTKRRLWLTIIGMVLVLILLLKFGIPLLINFSLFLSRANPTITTAQKSSSPDFIAPPSLDTMPNATSSAQINVSGTASSHEKIELYVNNSLTDAQATKDDGTFRFTNVSLQNGDNSLKVKAKINDKESDYSQDTTVTYKNSAPKLDVSNPHDGQTFSKDDNSVNITGQTDPDVKVTVNDFWAINDNGNFSYNLHLQNGDNQIKILAIDSAGNKTEKDMKVTYNP